MRGRPLRFLAATLGGWTAARIAVLATDAAPVVDIAVVAPPVASLPQAGPRRATRAVLAIESDGPKAHATLSIGAVAARDPIRVIHIAAVRPPASVPDRPSAAVPRHAVVQAAPPTLPPPLPPVPVRQAAGRLAGSVWAIGRGGGSDASVPGAQLGGSQAGMRLTYALGSSHRLAIAGRASTPLAGRGREAALGVEWRPLAVPVRLIAEQRWSLDGGRGGPTLMAVAGLPPTPVGPLQAEAYAQAGAIARGRVDGFADGAARLVRAIAQGPLRLDLGIGAWGGAQPGAARLDVGPSLGMGVPIGERGVRVTLDWRQRIAGRARPGSGPALSIGSDF